MKPGIHCIRVLYAGLLLGLMSIGASAHATLIFNPSWEDSSVHGGSKSIHVSLSGPHNFSPFVLETGESHSFKFLDVSFDWLGHDNSTGISAELAFTEPEGAVSGADGDILRKSFLGFFLGGKLTWDQQPGHTILEDGTIFDVNFSEIHVSVLSGTHYSVWATVTALASPDGGSTRVSEPAPLLLLGAGLLALAWARRRLYTS